MSSPQIRLRRLSISLRIAVTCLIFVMVLISNTVFYLPL